MVLSIATACEIHRKPRWKLTLEFPEWHPVIFGASTGEFPKANEAYRHARLQ